MQDPERPAAGETVGLETVVPVVAERDPHGGKAGRGALRPPAVQYLGFRSTGAGREYSLRVTGGLGPRVFVVLVTHETFASGEARFQDAPDLCFTRLQRDLAADPDLLPGPLLALTSQEIFAYRDARQKRPLGSRRRRSTG
jgi:hypothetical protein